MITPSHFLLMATDAPSKPPMASDEVAIRPQTNALNMTYLSSGEDGIFECVRFGCLSKQQYGGVVVRLPRRKKVIVRRVVDADLRPRSGAGTARLRRHSARGIDSLDAGDLAQHAFRANGLRCQ